MNPKFKLLHFHRHCTKIHFIFPNYQKRNKFLRDNSLINFHLLTPTNLTHIKHIIFRYVLNLELPKERFNRENKEEIKD